MRTNQNSNNKFTRFLPLNESVEKGLELEPKISDFEIIKSLGNGSFSKVVLVKHKITKVKYALKIIDKNNQINIEEKSNFKREIEIMYKLNHINFIKLFSHFEDELYCYFIMEYIPYGNLYSYIKNNNKIPPEKVSNLIKQLVSAIYYLHNMIPPIIHRDIKPENILLGENDIIKLIDFGWSNYINSEIRNTFCGTPVYLAPEMIDGNGHNEKVDIWCIGILLFEMLIGRNPFYDNNRNNLIQNIMNVNISWDKNIDNDARNLIELILKKNPNDRIELKDIIKHKFIKKYNGNAENSLIKPEDTIFNDVYIVCKDNPIDFQRRKNEWEKKRKEKEKEGFKKNFPSSEDFNQKKNNNCSLIMLKQENDNLLKELNLLKKENLEYKEKLEKKNIYIFRLENQNFLLDESNKEKEEALQEKKIEIEQYKEIIQKQGDFINLLYSHIKKQNNQNLDLPLNLIQNPNKTFYS